MNDIFQRGFLELGTWHGLRMRVHWSFFLGLLVFGGLRFAPGFWLGFTLLLVIHELGHAVLVRMYGYAVLSIELTGIGGLCRWTGYPSQVQRSVIAWGGVLGQALLLVPAALLAWLMPLNWFTSDLLYALTWSNLLLIGLNLLPVPMFDGAEAWKLFRAPGGFRAVLRRRGHGQGARRRSKDSGPGWFPRGVGANSKKRSRKPRPSHLRDVSFDPNKPADKVAADLLRIAEEARKANNRPN